MVLDNAKCFFWGMLTLYQCFPLPMTFPVIMLVYVVIQTIKAPQNNAVGTTTHHCYWRIITLIITLYSVDTTAIE